MVVSKRETSVAVWLQSMLGTYEMIWFTMSAWPMTRAVVRASMAVAPQPFLSQWSENAHSYLVEDIYRELVNPFDTGFKSSLGKAYLEYPSQLNLNASMTA